MDDSQVTRRYDTIIGCDILSELNIDSCFSDNTIRGNGVTYEGYTAPIKHVSKLILTRHLIGLKVKYFIMKHYWRANMCWIPCGVHVTS